MKLEVSVAGAASGQGPKRENGVDLRRLTEIISQEMSHERFVERLEVARFSPDDILDIELSYNFAKFGHREQYRESGEPYFWHPRAVAVQLVEIRIALFECGRAAEARAGVTKEGLILALHHDTVEDTKLFGGEGLRGAFASEISAFRLLQAYGVDVMCGIDALTKVEAEDHGMSREEAKLASVEKVIASDPMTRRVKQSDRLHNLRTLGVTPPAKQRRIVKATLDQYVPSWRRDAAGGAKGRIVSQILLDLVEQTIAQLEESWKGQDETRFLAESSVEVPVHHIDIERATAYAIIDGIPGLRIVERQLIHFAYDIVAYGSTSEEDAAEDGGLSFDQIKDATFDLIDEMTRQGAHDWKLIAASILRDTVEHDYIFGSDSIPGMTYEEVASRNLAKVFGSEVLHLVLSQTRPAHARDVASSGASGENLERLPLLGAAAVLLQMTDTVERLKKLGSVSEPGQHAFVATLERGYMPIFEDFAQRPGRLQALLVRYLDKIQTQKGRIEHAWRT